MEVYNFYLIKLRFTTKRCMCFNSKINFYKHTFINQKSKNNMTNYFELVEVSAFVICPKTAWKNP